MLRRSVVVLLVVVAQVVFLVGCGGGSGTTANSNPITPVGSSPMSISMKDNPPEGVSVLTFEVTLTSAVLQPGNVQAIDSPIHVEIKKLETETAFLNTATVPAGNYTSITLTFTQAELTVKNDSAAAIGSCAVGAICELKPAVGTVSYSGTPFPLTVAADSPFGLLLDFDLNASVQTDLSINPVLSFQKLGPVQSTGQLEEIETTGRVTAKDTGNNRVTIEVQPSETMTFDVDATTVFEDFDEQGLANSFESVAVDQMLEVDLRLLGNGTFVAKKVELDEIEAEDEFEGTVVSVGVADFQMVVTEEMPDVPGVAVGDLVTVTLDAAAEFRIGDDDLPVPAGASFAGLADVMTGQNLEIRPLTVVSTEAGIAVTSDRVKLKGARLTAQIKSKGDSLFNLENLPSLFTTASPAVTEIEVHVSEKTEFEEVSGFAALNVADTVSVRGLLFNTSPLPKLAAKKVRKR